MVRLRDSWRFSLSASPIPENPLPAPSAGVRIIARIGHSHRRLIERREEYGVGLACLGEEERATEIFDREAATCVGRRGGHDLIRMKVVQIDEHEIAEPSAFALLRRGRR